MSSRMQYTQVSLYAEAQPLLHKYGGKSTFRAIGVEADFVAQGVHVSLWMCASRRLAVVQGVRESLDAVDARR